MPNLKLSDILDDHLSGASTLYQKTLNLLIADERYQSLTKTKDALRRLRRSFPEMAGFVYLQDRLTGIKRQDLSEILNRLRIEALEEILLIGRCLGRVWKKKRRVIAFSRSSLVTYALVSSKTNVQSVLISCGSPRDEGVIAAEELAAQGIDVELVTDAALPGLIGRSDYILLGADCVTEKYFVNKTGTYPLLLAARAAGARSLVLHERFKCVSSSRFPFRVRQHPGAELAGRRLLPKPVTVTNAYFEAIDKRLVDYFITGEGIQRKG